jgi:hypothetical protein
MIFPEYPKIETVFQRDISGTKKLIEGQYRDETVEYLADLEWLATEKIDGTNVRVCWDGHAVEFKGRTDSAQLPAALFAKLNQLFGGEDNAQLFEQAWGETPVMLCGEGYGVKIQGCGARYILDGVNFRLFDVFIPSQNLWLRRASVEDVAQTFGVECAPVVATGTLMELVAYVKCRPCSQIAADSSLPMEGVVARPAVELKNRRGGRVIVKIKARDFA